MGYAMAGISGSGQVLWTLLLAYRVIPTDSTKCVTVCIGLFSVLGVRISAKVLCGCAES